MKQIIITINNKQIPILNTSASLLELLEQHNINIDSQCRDGFCGACRCQLKNGSVKEIKNILAFTEDDEILACSTTPITDIEIKLTS